MVRNGLLIYSFAPQPKARFAPLILAYGCGLNKEPSNQQTARPETPDTLVQAGAVVWDVKISDATSIAPRVRRCPLEHC